MAARNNNVNVAELVGDTAFVNWLDVNGLTLAEAARIQVPYFGGPMPVIEKPNSGNVAYAIGSVAAISGSIATSLWTTRGNADGHRRLSNFAGLAASAASLGLGITAARGRAAPPAVAPLALVAGSVSAVFSTRGLLRYRAYRTAQRDAAHWPRVGSASIVPILPIARVSGAGVAIRLAF